MNERQIAPKIRQAVAKVKPGLTTLVEDRVARLVRLEDTVSQATDDLTTWVGDSVSQLNGGIEKLTVEAKETVKDTAATVKKEVRHGLGKYNAKAQKIADKVPGGFSKKVSRYPWVAISIALTVGFLAGSFLLPRRPLG